MVVIPVVVCLGGVMVRVVVTVMVVVAVVVGHTKYIIVTYHEWANKNQEVLLRQVL